VLEEQLFQGRLAAYQLVDAGCGQDPEQWLDGPSHLAAHDPPGRFYRTYPFDPAYIGDRAVECGFDRKRGEVPQLHHGPHFDQHSFPQDRYPVAQRFHFAQDVRGKKDRLPALASLADAAAELLLHQRVQARRRLVEDEQVGAGHQGGY
jgi:hypothetical protein